MTDGNSAYAGEFEGRPQRAILKELADTSRKGREGRKRQTGIKAPQLRDPACAGELEIGKRKRAGRGRGLAQGLEFFRG